MQKPTVCMFCRYRRTTSHAAGPAPCCAGEAAPRQKTPADERLLPPPAHATPEQQRPRMP
jgi:hypothetical protein